jgi:hypothetical protein
MLATAVVLGFGHATDRGDHRRRSAGAVAPPSGIVRRSFGVLAPVLGTANFGFGDLVCNWRFNGCAVGWMKGFEP